ACETPELGCEGRGEPSGSPRPSRPNRNGDSEILGGVEGGDPLALGRRKVGQGAVEERAGARPVGGLERVERLPEQVLHTDVLAVQQRAPIEVEGRLRVALEI